MKKIFLSLVSLFIFTALSASAKPVAGVSIISSDSSRGTAVAGLLEKHLITILNRNSSFSTIKTDIIGRELKKFNCKSEKCILRFARSAGIDLIISGSIKDRGEYIKINLTSYAPGLPFRGRALNSYSVSIPLRIKLSLREFSLISEEHSWKFLSETVSQFKYPVRITRDKGKAEITDPDTPEGNYDLYTMDREDFYYRSGRVTITGLDVKPEGNTQLTGNSFIIRSFGEEGQIIRDYYNTKKREIVFTEDSLKDTLYMFFLTVPASATMPIAAPIFGYMENDDWAGLGLWAVHTSPYLYAEARGQINSPSRLKDKHSDITRDDRAMNYFSWYMILAGGTPLFVDAFAHESLMNASYFRGKQELMGNPYTAAYLSLISNGGGHFYRGNRFWGYFYFHLNNSLLYMTLREYSKPEYYDASTDSYRKGKRNSRNAAIFGSFLFISKTVEIIHAVTSNDEISNGTAERRELSAAPFFSFDNNADPVYGLSVNIPF